MSKTLEELNLTSIHALRNSRGIWSVRLFRDGECVADGRHDDFYKALQYAVKMSVDGRFVSDVERLARENCGLLLMLKEAHGDVSAKALRETAKSRADDYIGMTGTKEIIDWTDLDNTCKDCGEPWPNHAFQCSLPLHTKRVGRCHPAATYIELMRAADWQLGPGGIAFVRGAIGHETRVVVGVAKRAIGDGWRPDKDGTWYNEKANELGSTIGMNNRYGKKGQR